MNLAVSILILLEVTLEVDINDNTMCRQVCFNPYSIGSYFGSKGFFLLSWKILPVSILILLEVTLEA